MPCVLYPKGSSWSRREDGDVRESSQPPMGRRQRIRGNAIKEMKAKHAHRRRKLHPVKTRTATITYQRISCDKDLLPVGTRRLRPTSAGSRLHRTHIPPIKPVQKDSSALEKVLKNLGLRRAEVRDGKWQGIRSSLQTAARSACRRSDRAAVGRMAGKGA